MESGLVRWGIFEDLTLSKCFIPGILRMFDGTCSAGIFVRGWLRQDLLILFLAESTLDNSYWRDS